MPAELARDENAGRARLAGLDALRGGAVLAMAAFHFNWDLGHFGYIDPEFPYTSGVKAVGHAIAASFLFIAGVSLVLAHEARFDGRGFWRRVAIVAGAAALVSAGTYALFPGSYVFFGVLHCIAAASLLAAPFARRAWVFAALAAAAALAAPLFLRAELFDAPLLQWVGLSTFTPTSNDYRPLFPGAGLMLLGVAAARFFGAPAVRGFFAATRAPRAIGFLGRHSLAVYLAHQPILFGLFSAIAFVSPAPPVAADFISACESRCVESGGAKDYCASACECAARAAERDKAALQGDDRAEKLAAIGRACARNTAEPAAP